MGRVHARVDKQDGGDDGVRFRVLGEARDGPHSKRGSEVGCGMLVLQEKSGFCLGI